MKKFPLLLVMLYMASFVHAQSVDQPWRQGILKDEFIYDTAPFPSCHAATIAETPEGLVAAWFGGLHERHPNVEIYVSRLVNDKWTVPVSVADGVQNDTLRYPTWNPVLYQAPGELLLFYKVGPKPSAWWGMIKTSADGGKTWSAARKLPDGYIGPVKNKPVLLSNGNLICPSSTEGNGWKIHFEITPDFGKTWRKVGPVSTTEKLDAIQPSVLDHGNGKLQILARSRNRAIVEAWSTDNGETWSPLAKTNLPNNNSGTDAVTLRDGRSLLVYNHVLPPGDLAKGPRTPLNVSVSKNGKSWQAALILEDSHISQYSYPSVIQTSDGLVHIVYTWRRERIKHVVVDPSRLKFGTIANGQWPLEQYLQTYEQGKAQLDQLASAYHDKASWEKRKDSLRQCIIESYHFPAAYPRLLSTPVHTPKRLMDGYTVENISFEILPGVYIAGSLYQPIRQKGKIPVILCPDGHWAEHRYRPDCQIRCAMLAKMGAMAISYDLMAWGESLLQFKPEDHQRKEAMTVQTLSSVRILDYLCSLKNADTTRIAITGGSGGGSMTMQVAAIDKRIKLSVPVVMLSCFHSGGCPCENGMGIHLCGGGTLNPEIAAMAAPMPQLVISDGKDWTQHVPETEFPYLQRIYGFYGKTPLVQNAHFPQEGHDYGVNKRRAMYEFVAKYFKLNIKPFRKASGDIDESGCTIEKAPAMYAFGKNGENLPANAIKGLDALKKILGE